MLEALGEARLRDAPRARAPSRRSPSRSRRFCPRRAAGAGVEFLFRAPGLAVEARKEETTERVQAGAVEEQRPGATLLRCLMASAVLEAVETYIELWSERDAAVRAAMLERCFAEDGRIVLPTRELRGRAALAREIETFQADPQVAGIRIVSVIDAQGLTFRFAAALDRRDGTSSEAFDAGLIDDSGRICLILTFGGRLADAPPT